MSPTKRITVKDLARICDVSIGTVDRALNNRGRICPETKAKILAAAKEYGYIKNQFAHTLSSGKSNLIGVIVLTLRNEYFPSLLTGIDAEAHARGYATLFMVSDYSAEKEKSCVARMLSMNVAGIIVCSVLTEPSYYSDILASGTPIVAVSNRIGDDIPYSGIDDEGAMCAAADYILSRGWEHIYYISPALSKKGQNLSAQWRRAQGFSRAMEQKGSRFDIIGEKAALEQLTPDCQKRCALLCSSDAYTLRCLVKFRKQVEKRELGLMGFDNLATLRLLHPELTAVSYDTCRIGSHAVQQLLDGEDGELIPYEIIGGDTI